MFRVIKLGGSHLLRPKLQVQVESWLDSQTPAKNLFVVGGGELIEAVRRFDSVHGRNPVDIHWMCVRLLDYTYNMVSELFPRWHRLDSYAAIQEWRGHDYPVSIGIAKVSGFYSREAHYGLPCSWATTTDSIAAALASVADADELVLLKSCEIPSGDLNELVELGVVDRAFPVSAGGEWQLRLESPFENA